jgi:methylenetetrahydrofolate dehydrogenase (NADP+)/methenyltetrahydrofolate cyclohydrolase
MANILDGKLVSQIIKNKVKDFVSKQDKNITLTILQVGDNQASNTYIRNKQKACKEVGIKSEVVKLLAADDYDDELAICIEEKCKTSDGVMIQLPLPTNYNEHDYLNYITSCRDADCLTDNALGKFYSSNHPSIAPCTAQGIIDLLKYYQIPIAGKRAVVVGRSNIVGKPVAHLLTCENATVTLCHSKTENLESITREADILVVAIGKPCFIKADMVKDGAVVIDVGINRCEDGKLCGDVDFASVEQKASWITPVPGGVGPMTVAELLKNTMLLSMTNNVNVYSE